MNMEEWQRKLKAEKDSARQKKTESAEILRGYRRGEINDDDLKLKVLREEERKRQLDAQQNLHNYKNTQIQEGLNKPKERQQQHYPTPVNTGDATTGRDLMEGITMGSISERAAVFDVSSPTGEAMMAPTTPQSFSKQQQQQQQEQSHPATADDDDDDDDDVGPTMPPIETTVLLSLADASLAATEVRVPPFVSNPFDAQQHEPDSLLGAGLDPKEDSYVILNGAGEERADLVSATLAAPDSFPSTLQATIPNSSDNSNTNSILSATASTNDVVATAASISPLPKTQFRAEALFSFGLVTIRPNPDLTSYMAAVQSVVMTTSSNSSAKTSSGESPYQYDSLSLPYVKFLEWDGTCLCLLFMQNCFFVVLLNLWLNSLVLFNAINIFLYMLPLAKYVSRTGRPDVKRLVVTAAVPIVVAEEATIASCKQTVVAALQASIQSGDFLVLAQEKN